MTYYSSLMLAAAAGLVAGSVIGHLVYRIYWDQDATCRFCKEPLLPKAKDSWQQPLLLPNTRCSSCGKRVSRHFTVTWILTPLTFAFIYHVEGRFSGELIRLWFMAALFIFVGVGDWWTRRIRVYTCFVFTFLSLILAALSPKTSIISALIGGLAAWAVMFVLYLLGRLFARGGEALGKGDVWFAVPMGTFVGSSIGAVSALALAMILSTLIDFPLRKILREDQIPLGSYMAISGFLFALFYGGQQ